VPMKTGLLRSRKPTPPLMVSYLLRGLVRSQEAIPPFDFVESLANVAMRARRTRQKRHDLLGDAARAIS
jgi:hypothetical protein